MSRDGINPVTGQPLARAPSSSAGTPARTIGSAAKALAHGHDHTWDPVTNTPKKIQSRAPDAKNNRVSGTKRFNDGSATKDGFNPLSGKSGPVALDDSAKPKATNEVRKPSGVAGGRGLTKEEVNPLTGQSKPREIRAVVAGTNKKELADHGSGHHQKPVETKTRGKHKAEVAANSKADVFGNPIDRTPSTKSSGANARIIAENNKTDVMGNPANKKGQARVGGTVKKEAKQNNEVNVLGGARNDPSFKGQATSAGAIKTEQARNNAVDVFGNPTDKKGKPVVSGSIRNEASAHNAKGMAGALSDEVVGGGAPAYKKPAKADPPAREAGGKGLSKNEVNPVTGDVKPRVVKAKVAGSIKAEYHAQGQGAHHQDMERISTQGASSHGAGKKHLESNKQADVMGGSNLPKERQN